MGNVVLNKPATASSYVSPYTPSRAVNGTVAATSRWLCNTVPCWLSVNLQTTVWINRWVVRHMPVAGWAEPQYVLSNFKLQGSLNGTSWFDLSIVSDNTSKVTDRTFTAVAVAFVRVYVTSGLQINPKLASFVELEVYEAPATSPYLTNLTLSSGTLNPAFAKGTLTYSAQVGFDVDRITLVPTAEDPQAIIKVNGVVVASGQSSNPQMLNIGNNTIQVQVTSLIGGLVQNYTVNVTRASSPYLTSLSLQNGTTAIELNPVFSQKTFTYNALVANSVSSITVKPVPEDPNGTVKVNGVVVPNGQSSAAIPLSVGTTDISVEVTSSIGNVTQAYTIHVLRSSNCLLSNLVLMSTKAVALTPGFTPTDFTYTASVPRSTPTVTLTPTASDNPTILIRGVQVPSGQASDPIALEIGNNVINIEVTATIGGTQQSYVLTVTRREI